MYRIDLLQDVHHLGASKVSKGKVSERLNVQESQASRDRRLKSNLPRVLKNESGNYLALRCVHKTIARILYFCDGI